MVSNKDFGPYLRGHGVDGDFSIEVDCASVKALHYSRHQMLSKTAQDSKLAFYCRSDCVYNHSLRYLEYMYKR